MKNIISVVGPTASGKSDLSVALARYYDGEIVSVDSMQIYRHMNIGTAKITPYETQGIVHHMIDCFEPYENCSVQKFISLARKSVDDILARGKRCILVGGTGLYVDHLIHDTQFIDIPTDIALRSQLDALSQQQLCEKLNQLDPVTMGRLHPNDKKRVIRAIEIFLLTGKSIRHWEELSHEGNDPLDVTMIGLTFADRERLYKRINERVDRMINDGLVDEVRHLMSINGFSKSTAADGIGYKEICRYINGEILLEEAVEQIKQNTRRYAKRQGTWFRRNPKIRWIAVDRCKSFEEIKRSAIKMIERD